jgi:alpha-glucosidase
MRDFYKKLILFRKAHPALLLGTYKTILINDEQQIFGFVRTFEDEAVYVLLNNSDKTQVTKVTLPKNQTYRDIITGDRYETTMETRTFALPPKNGLILVREIYYEKNRG